MKLRGTITPIENGWAFECEVLGSPSLVLLTPPSSLEELSSNNSETEQNTTTTSLLKPRTDCSLPRSKKSASRGSRYLPPGEELTFDRIAYAEANGLTRQRAEREWRKFSLYEFARPYRNWSRCWMNWCLKAAETPDRHVNHLPPTKPTRDAVAKTKELLAYLGGNPLKSIPSGGAA